ncbi:hypothetical protein I5E68_13550 [Novosphingobium sp. YJ-S2-02]|uniref:Uncharacterized protein n=1 Tax=Novosphingobium aureum TaxID=2792964 RepID=A0A931HD98_9SPHN|nr:hypothetical protein [Novosphingobium aureum]MBH0113967.1 hypothetical protein [Novosphingobium aureum]
MRQMDKVQISTATLRTGMLRASLERIAQGERPVLLLAPDARISADIDAFLHAVLANTPDQGSHCDTDCMSSSNAGRNGGTSVQAPGPGPEAAFVAGTCLSLPRFMPFAGRVPFVPIEDGSSVLWLRCVPQVAAMFTPLQARRIVAAWPGTSTSDAGFLDALRQLDGYLVSPRQALAHDGGRSAALSRALGVGARDWRIGSLARALAIYDHDLEIAPQALRRFGTLPAAPFAVDLWERGRALPDGVDTGTALLLSSRGCRRPLLQFALDFVPPEANMMQPDAGEGAGFFSLGRAEDFAPPNAARRATLVRHATRYNDLGAYLSQLLGPLGRFLRRGQHDQQPETFAARDHDLDTLAGSRADGRAIAGCQGRA